MEKTIVMGDPGIVPVDTASMILKRLYYVEWELMRTLGGSA